MVSGCDDGAIRSWPIPVMGNTIGSRYDASLQGIMTSHDTVAAFSVDNTVLIKRPEDSDWVLLQHPSPVSSTVWHPTKRVLATASWDGKVRLWHLEGKHVPEAKIVAQYDGYALGSSWDTKGEWLASSGVDGTILLTSVSDGRRVARRPHQGRVDEIVFSTQTGTFVSAGRDGSLCSLHANDHSSRCVRASDSQQLMTLVSVGSHGVVAAGKQGRIFLWNGRDERVSVLGDLPGAFRFLRVSADSQLIAASDDQGNLALYDLERGSTSTSQPCDGDIWNIAVSANGTFAAAACKSGEVAIWNYDTNQQWMVRIPRGRANAVEFSLDEKHLRAATLDGVVRDYAIDKIEYVPRTPTQLRAWIRRHIDDRNGRR